MVPSMRTATPDVHGRIAALIRADARNGSEWATLLGMGRQSLHDRLRLRTPWTLCDAITVADTLGMTLDALVGDEDLPTGYTVTAHGRARLTLDRLEAAAAVEDLPRTGAAYLDTMLDGEAVAAEVAALHLHPVPAYEDVDR